MKNQRNTHSSRKQPKNQKALVNKGEHLLSYAKSSPAFIKYSLSQGKLRSEGQISARDQHKNSKISHLFTPLKSNTIKCFQNKQKFQLKYLEQYATSQRSAGTAPRKSDNAYNEHLFQTFQSLKFCKTLPDLPLAQISDKILDLPKRRGFKSKKTVIFDLDETLVHCVNGSEIEPDIVLPLQFPTGEISQAGITIRPFARECLKEANKYFEVIVFTASHQCYADAVLNFLDPTRELVHHRLYRDSCIQVNGVFIKDLRVLSGRRLGDMILVDNAAHSFGYQLDNGIPIISWIDDRSDRELFNLMNYMKLLAKSNDIRTLNRETFRLHSFYDDYLKEYFGDVSKDKQNQ